MSKIAIAQTGTNESKVATKVQALELSIGRQNVKQNFTQGFTPATFLHVIGSIINSQDEKVIFSVSLDSKKIAIELTGKTIGNDTKERTYNVVKQAAMQIFSGMENTAIVGNDKPETISLLHSLKDSGFKFSHFSKVAVLEAVNVWIANKRAKREFQKKATQQLNSATIAETNTVKDVNKIVKEKGYEAARLYVESKKIPALIMF
jgi:hypothetical protein